MKAKPEAMPCQHCEDFSLLVWASNQDGSASLNPEGFPKKLTLERGRDSLTISVGWRDGIARISNPAREKLRNWIQRGARS